MKKKLLTGQPNVVGGAHVFFDGYESEAAKLVILDIASGDRTQILVREGMPLPDLPGWHVSRVERPEESKEESAAVVPRETGVELEFFSSSPASE